LDGVGIEEVTSLACLIEMKVNEVKKRIEGHKGDVRVPKSVVKEEKMKMEEAAVTAKEKSPMEELQREEWFTDIMNHSSSISSNHHNNPWLDAYFPLN